MQHSKLRSALHHSNSAMFDMRPYKSMGEPVGTPFGGAAYGEKNSGLFKAVVSVAGIVATVMTAGAATPLLAGIMYAGAALSTIGLVTGNKTLGMIGGLASMGAGLASSFSKIGNIAQTVTGVTDAGTSNLDLIKAASNSAGSATSGITKVAENSSAFSGAGAGSGTAIEGIADTGNSIFEANKAASIADNNLGGMQANSSSVPVGQATYETGGGYTGNGAIDQVSQSSQPIQNSSLPTNANASVDNYVKDFTATAQPATDSVIAPRNMASSTTDVNGMPVIQTPEQVGLLGGIKDKFSGLFKTIQDNPVATKLIGDFVQGAYQSPQDKAKAQAMIDYYNQQTSVSQQQMANAKAVPTMNLTANPNAKVQFNTSIRAPQGMGLLNRSQPV